MTEQDSNSVKKKILLIDDDEENLKSLQGTLESAGFEIKTCSSSARAMEYIGDFKPDLAIMELLLGEPDGYTLLRQIRKSKDYSSLKVIILTVKSFEFDRVRSFELGADAFFNKPISPEELLKNVSRTMDYRPHLTFWGTRGSLPSPGSETIKYGGNTSCIEVRLSQEKILILDAGTGIRKLGLKLMQEGGKKKINLLLTHPHWDHIFGLPFFVPTYIPGNEVSIYGARHGDISLREVVAGQMESIYFPITIKEFGARSYFQELSEGEYFIDDVKVQTHFLNHPGQTLGYRIWCGEKSFAYITDNELPPPPPDSTGPSHKRKKLINFLKDVDLLIHDSSYTDQEYKTRVGWGHPPLSELLSLALAANAKELKLFHHEPDHTDQDIEKMVEFSLERLKKEGSSMKCSAAAEGEHIFF